TTIEKPNHRQLLLGARSERPRRDHNTAEKCNELARPHHRPPKLRHAMVATGCDARKRYATFRMSALGHKRTYAVQNGMSASPPKADMCGAARHVCIGPIADSCTATILWLFDYLVGGDAQTLW